MVIGVVDGFNFLLLLSVRVILALLVTEINFPFGTFCMQPGWFFFSDGNLGKYDRMPIGVIHINNYL